MNKKGSSFSGVGANGMMVIAFDAPAHGQSGGDRTSLLDNLKVVAHIAKTYGPFEAAIGHSFGGISLLNAQAHENLFSKIISIGIEGSMDNIIDDFIEKIELKPKVSVRVKKDIHDRYDKKLDSISGNQAAKNISIPVLVLHDIDDNDVNVSSAFKLRQNLAQGSLLVTRGLGHRKILRDSQVIGKIIEFIKS